MTTRRHWPTATIWIMTMLTLFAGAAGAAGVQSGAPVPWSDALPDDVTIHADGSVTVTSVSDQGTTVTLAEIESPDVPERYVVAGKLKHRDVGKKGFLEMWNVFEEGSYFSRTQLEDGPMRSLSGTSDWRPVALPFDATGSASSPEKLIVNLVLPGKGEVTLSPLTLSPLAPGEWPAATGAELVWGVWSGVAGAVLGIVGGLLSWLGVNGRAKPLVLNGFRILKVLGGLALGFGLVALVSGAPWAVWFPLMLLGGIAFMVSWTNLRRFVKHYEELELRRLTAIDA